MAKNMARIENGIVVNVEWCSDLTKDTDSLVSCGDIPVGIGDSFEDGAFYRDGEKLLSYLDAAKLKIAEYEALINELYSEVTAE